MDFETWFSHICSASSEEHIIKVATLLWVVWMSINDIVWNGKVAHENFHTYASWIFCNVDVSVLNSRATFGVVVLSHRNEFLAAIFDLLSPLMRFILLKPLPLKKPYRGLRRNNGTKFAFVRTAYAVKFVGRPVNVLAHSLAQSRSGRFEEVDGILNQMPMKPVGG
nr:uncharacterized protein LOC109150345 [Ipomoea batatas]